MIQATMPHTSVIDTQAGDVEPGSRADGNLRRSVQRAINALGYMQLRSLSISAESGTVRLDGRVTSYYLKQIAQVRAMEVAGVENLHNELQVV